MVFVCLTFQCFRPALDSIESLHDFRKNLPKTSVFLLKHLLVLPFFSTLSLAFSLGVRSANPRPRHRGGRPPSKSEASTRPRCGGQAGAQRTAGLVSSKGPPTPPEKVPETLETTPAYTFLGGVLSILDP